MTARGAFNVFANLLTNKNGEEYKKHISIYTVKLPTPRKSQVDADMNKYDPSLASHLITYCI